MASSTPSSLPARLIAVALVLLAAACSSGRVAGSSHLEGRWYGLSAGIQPGVVEIEFARPSKSGGEGHEATFRVGTLHAFLQRGAKGLEPMDARARVSLEATLGRVRLEEFAGQVYPGQFPNVLRAGAELYLGDERGAGMVHLGPAALGQLGLAGWDGRRPTIADVGRSRMHINGIDVSACVVFWRKAEFEAYVEDYGNLLPMPPKRSTALSKLGGLLRGKPEIPDLQGWIAAGDQLASFERNQRDPLAWSVVPRFEGPTFERFFDEPFLQVSPRRLDAIADHIRGSFESDGLKPWLSVFDRSGASRPYNRGLGPADVAQGIAVREVLAEWAENRGRAIEGAGAEPADWAATEETIAILRILEHTALATDDLEPLENALLTAASSGAAVELFAEFEAFEQAQVATLSLGELQAWSTARSDRSASLRGPERERFDERLAGFRQSAIELHVPELRRSMEQLPAGIDGMRAGVDWNERFAQLLTGSTGAPQAKQLRAEFLERRRRASDAVAAEIEGRLETTLRQLPLVASPATQAQRLDAALRWYGQVSPAFALAEDRQLPAHDALVSRMRERSAPHLRLLPPRLRGELSRVRRSPAAGSPCLLAVPDEDDPRSICNDPGMVFRSNVCWAIFHGRFDELSAALYESDGMGARFTGMLTRAPARVHFAFAEFVRECSRRYGSDQIGREMTAWWRTVNTETGEVVADDQYKVTVSADFGEFYADSCEVAERVLGVDTLIGENFLGLLESLADPLGTIEDMELRGDGRIGMTTPWSVAISADVQEFLELWPHHSTGEVQFHKNLEAFLRGRPSLQQRAGLW